MSTWFPGTLQLRNSVATNGNVQFRLPWQLKNTGKRTMHLRLLRTVRNKLKLLLVPSRAIRASLIRTLSRLNSPRNKQSISNSLDSAFSSFSDLWYSTTVSHVRPWVGHPSGSCGGSAAAARTSSTRMSDLAPQSTAGRLPGHTRTSVTPCASEPWPSTCTPAKA